MLLLITYDLKKADKDYSALYDAIKSCGDKWWHYLESVWIVHTNTYSVETCMNYLRTVMDANDYLLVYDVTHKEYNGWLPSKAWEWIKSNNN